MKVNRSRLLSIVLCMFVAASLPNSTRAAEYEITHLSNGYSQSVYDDSNPNVSGDNVVWWNNSKIYFNDGSTTKVLPGTGYRNPEISGDQVVWDAFSNGVGYYNGASTTYLSSFGYDPIDPKISGDNIAWYGYLNGDPDTGEIFLHNGGTTTQITSNSLLDRNAHVDGDSVVWEGFDGNDFEIFRYDMSTQTTTQLTNNAVDDRDPQVSGDNITWWSTDWDIFLHDGNSTTQLTNDEGRHSHPKISGNDITWSGYDGNDGEIFMYDGVSVSQLTDNDYHDLRPEVSEGNIAWQHYTDGTVAGSEIFAYDGSTITQLTDNNLEDSYPMISGDTIAWQTEYGNNLEIFKATALPPENPDTPSNASFSLASDANVLNIDFGTIQFNSNASHLDFSIANLDAGGAVADLEFVSSSSIGDSTVLTHDVLSSGTYLTTGGAMAPGSSLDFEVALDTSTIGTYSATYEFDFSDVLGSDQTLILNLSAMVDIFDDPSRPNLLYYANTGELVIETLGLPNDEMLGYSLQSDSGDFLSANHTLLWEDGVSTSLPTEVGEASLTPITGTFSLGNVLPTNLTFDDLTTIISGTSAIGPLGTPVVEFDLLTIGSSLLLSGGCEIGDANCDGEVTISGDILPAFSNFTGPGSFGKTRAEGDIHDDLTGASTSTGPADGDVDVSDILTMFGAFTGPSPDEAGLLGAAAAGDPSIPDLVYNATTGEVVFDLDGAAGLIGYSLKSAGGFLAGGHTPILGGVTTSLTTELAEAALSTPGLPASIGFVFPIGMDLAALSAFLTDNTVSTGLGAPLVPFDLVVVGGAVVPEPSTYVMAAVGLLSLTLVGWRRRTSSR